MCCLFALELLIMVSYTVAPTVQSLIYKSLWLIYRFCFLNILYSAHDDKRKQKKVTHKSKNPSEIVSQKDSTVASWESKPGSTNPHVQGQGHSNDTDTCSSSVASFIQQKVNKKLMKATHRKREQGLLRGMFLSKLFRFCFKIIFKEE